MTTVLERAAERIRHATGQTEFAAAVVLGSGMGGVVDLAEGVSKFPYPTLFPDFPASLAGHAGRLVAGTLNGVPLLFFQGRFHLYQGLSSRQVALPAELANLLGCRRILLTNAAGGINADYLPGDFMYVSDHLNLQGDNPLRGMAGPAFLDLGQLYRQEYFERLRGLAVASGGQMHRGVYAAVTGPCYETPAEVRALQRLGADAVGMSTVPEALLAHYYGLEVVAISLVANRAAGLAAEALSHDDVLHTVEAALPTLTTLCRDLLVLWGGQKSWF